MNVELKKAEDLTLADIEKTPVWEYANNDEVGETSVRPVTALPVNDLNGKLVGTQLRLSCGELVWGLLANVDVGDPGINQQLLTVSIEHAGKWFGLARYHDRTYSLYGPPALASFLGRPVGDIFPIAYDISQYSKGAPESLAGKIESNPKIRLTRPEIIALTLRRRKL